MIWIHSGVLFGAARHHHRPDVTRLLKPDAFPSLKAHLEVTEFLSHDAVSLRIKRRTMSMVVFAGGANLFRRCYDCCQQSLSSGN